MINCKSCCYCGQGDNIRCPLYSHSVIHTENIRAIEKDANKSQTAGLYWAACLLYGYHTEKNERKAVAILEKLARKEFAPAQYLLSLCYFDGIKVRRDHEKAFELCHAAAMEGCNLAEIKMYYCYHDGVGVIQDFEQAKYWCGYAAGHQSSEVYYEYAEMCSSEKYGKTDMKEACIFLKRAAENGDATAYDRLVELHKSHVEECYDGYLNLSGVFAYDEYIELGDFCLENQYASNSPKALANYRTALGLLLDKKKQYEKDLQSTNEATKYFALMDMSRLDSVLVKCQERIQKCCVLVLEEATAGDATAQCCLGYCYYSGTGVEKNDAEALKWLRLSAEQGNAAAQCWLGNRFYNGDVVEKNYSEALGWYLSSANQGNADAQYNAGLCYYYGNGIRRDMAIAKIWFSRAAEQGHSNAKDMLAKVEKAYANTYSGPVNGCDLPKKLEPSIWYDWRTGERLLRNEDGEVVNGKGETVSVAWWD